MFAVCDQRLSYLATAFAVVIGVCAVDAAEIVLQRQATIDGDIVRLGDVATITAANTVEQESLARVVIGPAPLRQSILSAGLVRDRLQASGLATAETSLAGASTCTLQRTAQPMKAKSTFTYVSPTEVSRARDRLADELSKRLEQAFPERAPFAVSVSIASADAAIVNNISEPLQFRGGSSDLSAVQEFSIVGPQAARFSATIREVDHIAVAAVPLQRGMVIHASHLRFEPRDETGVTDPSLIIGQEAKRPVAVGKTIQQTDVRKVLLVRANQMVTVSSQMPGITVRRVMKSLQSGGIGDAITCETLVGKKTVSAVVTGVSTAKVASIRSASIPAEYRDETGSIQFTDAAPAVGETR